MRASLPLRFWIEALLGLAAGGLTSLTVALPDWIERLLGFGPDGGDGSTEWGVVALAAGFCLAFMVLAGRTWGRHARLAAQAAGR